MPLSYALWKPGSEHIHCSGFRGMIGVVFGAYISVVVCDVGLVLGVDRGQPCENCLCCAVCVVVLELDRRELRGD